MDPIASRDYVAVYFHTLVAEENSLSLAFLKDMYEMLDIKYVINAQSLNHNLDHLNQHHHH